MSTNADEPTTRIHSLDQESLVERLSAAAREMDPARLMDDLELQHLVRVITECSLLLSDVYSEDRLARIMHPERGFLTNLVSQLIEQQRKGEGEVLYRVRRLPDDVRLVGDKALFDFGLFGQRQVKGYDLEELGARAYKTAGEVLEQLAEDRRLREFFKQNRLLVLPLEEEVLFLKQCSEKFRRYADILQRSHREPGPSGVDLARLPVGVPLLPASTLSQAEAGALVRVGNHDPYVDAARGLDAVETDLTREQQISAYERILLFSALDLDRLRAALDRTVIDQQAAVQTICDEFSLFAAGTRDTRKPPAYFMVGPTGVGKNHLVESLCRALEGIWKIEVPVLTIEGPNYTYPSDINELRGATRGFIRSDEEGLLTSFHEKSSRAPFSVMLIDEVEKAHPQLLTFFLSILDRGTTTDNRGDVLNFSNCMLFFTSNLGYSDAQQGSNLIGYSDADARSDAADKDIRRDLKRALKPEFMNRVRMVHFNRLTRASIDRIFDLELDRIVRRYDELHELKIEIHRSAREELIRLGFSPVFGARHLSSVLEQVCNVAIARKIREDDRSTERDRDSLVSWLREMRAGSRPFHAEQVRERVRALASTRLPYHTLRVVFENDEFAYVPLTTGSASEIEPS